MGFKGKMVIIWKETKDILSDPEVSLLYFRMFVLKSPRPPEDFYPPGPGLKRKRTVLLLKKRLIDWEHTKAWISIVFDMVPIVIKVYIRAYIRAAFILVPMVIKDTIKAVLPEYAMETFFWFIMEEIMRFIAKIRDFIRNILK
jgi:hypothetical protein